MLKTVIAALVLVSTAAAFVVPASAGPTGQPEPYYLDRASQNHDGATGN